MTYCIFRDICLWPLIFVHRHFFRNLSLYPFFKVKIVTQMGEESASKAFSKPEYLKERPEARTTHLERTSSIWATVPRVKNCFQSKAYLKRETKLKCLRSIPTNPNIQKFKNSKAFDERKAGCFKMMPCYFFKVNWQVSFNHFFLFPLFLFPKVNKSFSFLYNNLHSIEAFWEKSSQRMNFWNTFFPHSGSILLFCVFELLPHVRFEANQFSSMI